MATFETKIADSLINAEKDLNVAENLLKVVIPATNEPRIMLRVLEILYKETTSLVSIVLKHEHICKRIGLSKDSSKNLEVFFSKCSAEYDLSEEDDKNLRDILLLGKRHKESGFEFAKDGKIIVLNDDLSVNEIDKTMINGHMATIRKLLSNVRLKLSRRNYN